MDSNRLTAYNTLFEIEKNKAYSNIEVNNQIEKIHPESPAFVRKLVYGVLENKMYLDYILKQLIPKGLSGVKKQDLTLLRMGLYQIIFMDSVPTYASVYETVRLAKKKAKGREGFINGVLRGYERKKDKLEFPDYNKDPIEYLSIRYSFAKWIVKLWIDQMGLEKTEGLLKACNGVPSVSIRVNLNKISLENLEERLIQKGYVISRGHLSNKVLFAAGGGLLETEEYVNGFFSIQDEASVLAVETLNPKKKQIILDMCAAPGGKTLAIGEILNGTGKIMAFDVYAHKLELLEREKHRLGLKAIETGENDGTIVNTSLVGIADGVLVDGPCSGLGVIRRKPEIKYKELQDNGLGLAEKQLQILSISSEYVKTGGILLYSTCTINCIENESVVEKFLKAHEDFKLISQRQLLPGEDETDGFFICKMKKCTG